MLSTRQASSTSRLNRVYSTSFTHSTPCSTHLSNIGPLATSPRRVPSSAEKTSNGRSSSNISVRSRSDTRRREDRLLAPTRHPSLRTPTRTEQRVRSRRRHPRAQVSGLYRTYRQAGARSLGTVPLACGRLRAREECSRLSTRRHASRAGWRIMSLQAHSRLGARLDLQRNYSRR